MADWRNELNGILGGRARATRAEQENAQFETFLDGVALPALTEVAEELNGKHGRDAQVRRAPASVTLNVRAGDVEEISFRVMKHFVQTGILPRAEVRLNRGQRFVKYESMFKDDPQNYPISEVTKNEIIACFIKYYRLVMDQGQGGAAE
jgi:phage portal protein BeeE